MGSIAVLLNLIRCLLKYSSHAEQEGYEKNGEGGDQGGPNHQLTCQRGVAAHFLGHGDAGNRHGRCEHRNECRKVGTAEAVAEEQKCTSQAEGGDDDRAHQHAKGDLFFQRGHGGKLKLRAQHDQCQGRCQVGKPPHGGIDGFDVAQTEGDAPLQEECADAEGKNAKENALDQGVFKNSK